MNNIEIMSYESAKNIITKMVDIVGDEVSIDEFKKFDEAGLRAIEALTILATYENMKNENHNKNIESKREAINYIKANFNELSEEMKTAFVVLLG